MGRKFSVGLGPFGPCADRFCGSGYRENMSVMEKIDLASKVKELKGLELHYPNMFQEISPEEMKKIFDDKGLACSIVSANTWGTGKWGKGALTSSNASTRRDAIETVKKAMDASKIVGANKINLWLGQDGYDYAFQTNYQDMWKWLIEGVAHCGEHDHDVKVCLEYKLKEPRVHMAMSTVGKALLIANKTGLDNVGVNLDTGHALQAFENPAETAVLLDNENKLFHLHFNDNYCDWDWDMLPGTVFIWELVELLYWLDKLEYDQWYSLDIFVRREDPVAAIKRSFENINAAFEMVERFKKNAKDGLTSDYMPSIADLM